MQTAHEDATIKADMHTLPCIAIYLAFHQEMSGCEVEGLSTEPGEEEVPSGPCNHR